MPELACKVYGSKCISIPFIVIETVNTVEPVLKNCPIGHKYVVSQDFGVRFNCTKTCQKKDFARNIWSFKAGFLSWQWSLKTGFTVINASQ